MFKSLSISRARYERIAVPFFFPAALVVFTASGFAGLIYESIWSHYLKLFLGHAAYAQTLVLAMFMGAMACGAWLASRLSARWRDLLFAYAVIEALIGILSLAFHDLFVAATAFAFDHAIPALGNPAAVNAFKWTLAAALILPQSLLLGMTFPLMTGGVLRMSPGRSGYVVAMLYFTNSLGAAAGVLASAFFFIPGVGLPGTLIAAGVVNLAVAAAAILLPRRAAPAVPVSPSRGVPPTSPPRLLLAVAALTGMSSFMYEIGWIRMLALVLGSSTHAFELMLSAFILGIACGGLWVRRRIDAAADSVRLLGWVQVAMGIAALATLPVYGSTFRFMQQVMASLAPTETGYVAFNLLSHGICLAVMFPAAFCAGMTLPLITASLLRAGAGERAIGQVYAANTAGAILGVLLAVHAGFVLLGLKGLIVAAAALDLALGVLLLAPPRGRPRPALAAAGIAAASLLAAVLGVRLDAHDMASGVFRLGLLLDKQRQKVELQLDGKTATVSVTENSGVRVLRTNGKPEAAVRVSEGVPKEDEVTMTLLGALPQFLVPQARRVGIIGFGTGMMTHVLLASDRLEEVDTVEIEPAMVRAGERFRPFNARALDDPRSRIHYDDAKTYFSSHLTRYDVILSEPSNPWVSGVAGLFSTEFYRDVRRYLKDGGLFVQWVQLYEMNPALLASVIAAVEANFTDYELWISNPGDMIIVAAHRGRVPRPDPAAFANPRLTEALARFEIRNFDDLLLHRFAGRQAMAPYFAMFGAEPNSDFFPVLDVKAPMARFMRQEANDLLSLWTNGLPVLELFDPKAPQPDPARVSPGDRPWLLRAHYATQAVAAASYVSRGDRAALAGLSAELSRDLVLLRASLVDCRVAVPPGVLRSALHGLAFLVNQNLPAARAQAVWRLLEGSPCVSRLASVERDLLRLNAAIAARAPARITRAAQALLRVHTALDRDTVSRVVAAYMAARLVEGDRNSAQLAFRDYRAAISGASAAGQTLFRLLVGQAENLAPARVSDKNGQPGGANRQRTQPVS